MGDLREGGKGSTTVIQEEKASYHHRQLNAGSLRCPPPARKGSRGEERGIRICQLLAATDKSMSWEYTFPKTCDLP